MQKVKRLRYLSEKSLDKLDVETVITDNDTDFLVTVGGEEIEHSMRFTFSEFQGLLDELQELLDEVADGN